MKTPRILSLSLSLLTPAHHSKTYHLIHISFKKKYTHISTRPSFVFLGVPTFFQDGNEKDTGLIEPSSSSSCRPFCGRVGGGIVGLLHLLHAYYCDVFYLVLTFFSPSLTTAMIIFNTRRAKTVPLFSLQAQHTTEKMCGGLRDGAIFFSHAHSKYDRILYIQYILFSTPTPLAQFTVSAGKR